MTPEQALDFWYGRINYEQKTPRPGDLTLERMRALMRLLGNPQERLRIIHVAGTKGKGSTAAMLASILGQAGYRTGLFTSPHLHNVTERFQVAGQPILPEELTQRLEDIRAACLRGPRTDHGAGLYPLEERLTFFEVATALGFCHFAARRVETAVMEVGLGGRFDSTNVCQPLVSVITSISFDHTQQLGDTLAQIAFEKAGIIKPGRPVVSGVRRAEPRAVIERVAHDLGAPLRQLERDFSLHYQPAHITADCTELGRLEVRLHYHEAAGVGAARANLNWPPLQLGLVGQHQAANAALAVATVEELRQKGLMIGPEAVERGLARVQWPGRLEVVCRRPLVVVDCAHNVASATALLEALRTSFPMRTSSGEPVRRWLIFAGSRDKDLAGMLRVLAPAFQELVFTRFQNNPRCLAPEELAGLAPAGAPDNRHICASVAEAWQSCRALARPEDLVCVTGSVFLVGEFRGLFEGQGNGGCMP